MRSKGDLGFPNQREKIEKKEEKIHLNVEASDPLHLQQIKT
jgi:hypothetical protein